MGPLAPVGVQQVREDEDYKNTSRQLSLVLPMYSAKCVDVLCLLKCQRMWKRMHVCVPTMGH